VVRALRPADPRPRWHARQAILEKFEFFPIKCRAQRAYEGLKRREARGVAPSPFKIKVGVSGWGRRRAAAPPRARSAPSSPSHAAPG
jgi:hypothetical protein